MQDTQENQVCRDKNGTILNVGDKIIYCKDTPSEEIGEIMRFSIVYGDEYRPYVKWVNDSILHCDPRNVELHTSVDSEVLTKEEQQMLEKLLAKKQVSETKKANSENTLMDLSDRLYTSAEKHSLSSYLKDNIDEICDTLQTYKKYHPK